MSAASGRQPGRVILRAEGFAGGAGWLCFEAPLETIVARCLAEVRPALARVEAAVGRGLCAAGFVAYEAGPAFDPALAAAKPGPAPLLWFGLYRKPRRVRPLQAPPDGGAVAGPWRPSVSRARHAAAVRRIRAWIAAGDVYQVNHTFRLRAPFAGSAFALFERLHRAQPVPFAAFVDTGRHAYASLSPELFLRQAGARIESRPMKGTRPRGISPEEDARQARELADSPKERAENIMIVDMVRNDLGRIALPGSVRVPRRFQVERYRSVWQMTSTVEARTHAGLDETFVALFPPASITGAPKVRATQIIAALEREPRGLYTGCVGWVSPRGACFSVAIRTVSVDRARGRAEYGTGGGIVWDSTPAGEYAECGAKAAVLTADAEPFALLETMLWRPGRGWYLWRRHLARLRHSAEYFGIRLDEARIGRRLAAAARRFGPGPQRVRLLVDGEGGVRVEVAPLAEAARPREWRVALAAAPVADSVWLHHKTTRREAYERARAGRPGADDVLLWNTKGEITESTIANVVARRGGRLVTPPLACGLLPGTFRAELLSRGVIEEGVLRAADLRAAEELYLINSVRRWVRCRLV